MFYGFNLLAKLLGFWLIIYALQTIHSIYFGPLSNIPGPKLAAATRLILSFYKFSGRAEVWRHQLHERYGLIVRVAPTEVSFATSKAWKDVYGYAPGSSVQKLQKEPQFYIRRPGDGSIIIADDISHSRQRKAFANAFSDRAIKQQEPLLREHVDKLISNLKKISQEGQTTNIVKDYNYATFDIMGDLAWGEPLGCLENSSYTPWVSKIFATIKLGAYVTELRHYSRLWTIMRLLIPESLFKQRQNHIRLARERVDLRLARQDKNPRPDIWGLVLASNENQIMSRSEMYKNSQLLMVAGTETTATLLSGLTFHLLRNTHQVSILTEEIRNTFSSAADININNLVHLPYMNACINEAFRMYPPVPSALPRVTGPGGSHVCGFHLPEKTSVYVHQFSAYRNSKNFVHSNDYLPERWLDEAKSNPLSEFFHDDRSILNPFSIGPRNCLGINLAFAEIRLILACVLYNFNLEICDESRQWDEQKVFNLWEKGELRVRVKSTA